MGQDTCSYFRSVTSYRRPLTSNKSRSVLPLKTSASYELLVFEHIGFLTPAPKAGVIVVACAVRVAAAAAAGTNLVGVPQTKPMQ